MPLLRAQDVTTLDRGPAGGGNARGAANARFAYRDEVIFRKLNATLEARGGQKPASDRVVYRVAEVDEGSKRVRVESADDYSRGWAGFDQVIRFEEAVAVLSREVESRPKDAEVRALRGRVLLELKRFEDAEEDLDRAIQLDPSRGMTFVYRAMVRLYQGQTEEAISDCDRAITLDPSDPWAHAVRANVWLLKNDYEHADSDLDALIRLDGQKATEWSARFHDWLHERAVDEFGTTARLEPVKIDEKTVITHLWRADVAIRKSDASRAVVEYNEAIELDPKNALIYSLRAQAWAVKHERNKESLDYSRAIELEPTNLQHRLNRGASWSAQGRNEMAIVDFNEVIRLAPDNPIGYLYRGNEWRKHLKLDLAVDDYNRAIQVDPRCSQAYVSRGLVWKQTRQFEQAVREFQQLLTWDTANAEGHRTLARMLATCNVEDVRDGPRAVVEATAACELTHWQDPDCLDTLAAAQAEAGDFASAVATQMKAIKLVRDRPVTALQRSLNYGGRRGVSFQDRLAFYKSRKPCRE